MVETINKLIRVQRQLLQELGREPYPEEIAEKMGLPVERGSPRSCVLAGAFLRFMGIILTVSKMLRYAPAGEYVCATGARGARTISHN